MSLDSVGGIPPQSTGIRYKLRPEIGLRQVNVWQTGPALPSTSPGWSVPRGAQRITLYFAHPWASLVAQKVKNLPAMRETWVRSLGWEDPLVKGKTTHSSILAWRIPCTV